jgi:hypothetical protein
MGMSTSRGHAWTLAAAAAFIAVAVTGCVGTPMPTPTPTPSDTPSPQPTSQSGPILRPGQSALANQQFFDFVNIDLYVHQGRAPGQTIVDNLVAQGFIKADMEVTPDVTAIGKTADSVVVSVRIDDECLIGQFGAAVYTGTRAPVLGTGTCLVGRTRPIDW